MQVQSRLSSVAGGFFSKPNSRTVLHARLCAATSILGKLSGGKYMPLYTADIWAFTNLSFTLGHKLEDR